MFDSENALANVQRDDAGANIPAHKRVKYPKGHPLHLHHNVNPAPATPSGGSDNRESLGSQSGGAGNGIPARERGEVPKSRTPNRDVQRARTAHTRRENGSQDSTGKR